MTDVHGPMLDDLEHESLRLDAAGRIDQDLACVDCGYNLRGLSPEGRCPECGTAVRRSAHGGQLCFCDPVWVSRLAAGMDCVWWGMALFVLTPLIATPFSALADSDVMGVRSLVIAPFLYFGSGAALVAIGARKLTAPEPGGLDPGPHLRAGKVACWSARPAVAAWLMQAVVVGAGWGAMAVHAVLVPAAFILTGWLVIAVLLHAQTLVRPGRTSRLARHTREVAWGLGVTTLAGVPVVTVAITFELLDSAGFRWALSLGWQFGCAFAVLYVVSGIWAAYLVDRYTKVLREAARRARQTWPKLPSWRAETPLAGAPGPVWVKSRDYI